MLVWSLVIGVRSIWTYAFEMHNVARYAQYGKTPTMLFIQTACCPRLVYYHEKAVSGWAICTKKPKLISLRIWNSFEKKQSQPKGLFILCPKYGPTLRQKARANSEWIAYGYEGRNSVTNRQLVDLKRESFTNSWLRNTNRRQVLHQASHKTTCHSITVSLHSSIIIITQTD